MATLLDTLKKNLGQVAQPQLATDETGQIQQLVAAKKGIVGPASALGPKGLAVAETAAKGQTQQQLSQLGTAAQLQATQLGQAVQGEQLQQKQQEEALSAQRQEGQLRTRIQTENILRGLEQGRASLSEEQRRQGLEQVASNLRLQDRQYVDNLQREGAKSRLQDSISFNEALKKSILEDNLALTQQFYKDKSALDLDDREWQKYIASIDVDAAMQMMRDDARFATEQATIQGVGSVLTTGIGIAGKGLGGGFNQRYQKYVESERMANRVPMSYTSFKAAAAKEAEEIEQISKGGSALPTSTFDVRTLG